MKHFLITICVLLTFQSSSMAQDAETTPLSEDSLKNKTLTFKSTVFNSNFTVPLVRFNLIEKESQTDAKGNIAFFNSIGAGISWSMGRLEETYDNDAKVINTEFHNTFGIQVGFLFSANTGDASSNVFAPTLGINLLNFQFGLGYELGTLSEGNKRTFLTIAYAIPVSKLVKGGFWVQKKSIRPIESKEEGFFPN